MIKNFCIWYLNRHHVAVLLNMEPLNDGEIDLQTQADRVYLAGGNGTVNVWRKERSK